MAEIVTIPAIYYGQCKSLFEEIKDLDYAVVKGEPLSLLAYGELGKRRSGDIDILISREDIVALEKALRKNSFQMSKTDRPERILILSGSHQTKSWSKEISPLGFVCIDVNFDVFWGEYTGARLEKKEFLGDTVKMNIYGVNIKTLPPLKAMIYLILHHYKDMNSIFLLATRNSIRYEMFKDVYYLLRNNLETIPVDTLYAISAKYEIIPYVFYVLYYTGQIFSDNILKRYIEAFRTQEGEKLLDYYGLCSKEQKIWKYDFKTRLESNCLYELIKEDLTEKDREKIAINKRVFMGDSNERSDY